MQMFKMRILAGCAMVVEMQEMAVTEKDTEELFSELEHCTEIVQKQKIVTMDEMISEMNGDMFESIFTTELLDRLDRMMKKGRIGMENASWNEELVKLIRSIVQVFRATKKNYGEMSIECIKLIRSAAESVSVKVEDLLKGGAINAVLEEIGRPTLNYKMAYECLKLF
ncbi:uncharacterized protein MONOS_18238 [Monocercomonoides exilis]|uniref:uncharacterized protein n=1 Tax=Monocercomonoides exilis TaxID=2049356 RepID=UPI00355A94D6|nr:hypothetical protein MONOS_18238 [Monocercomonoides exilis]